MPKCDYSDKQIAKISLILECNKCSKTVHGNQACIGLTSKQLAALRNTENLEWTSVDCRRESPRYKSFAILEVEEEELVMTQGNESGSSAMKKLLNDISLEVKKSSKERNRLSKRSSQFLLSKMDVIMDNLV
ncbi:unnamed protein product [Parnassius mnemosyne]|uniref:Uncharacterized protein n=1 Tax=Parnassius mnemosyne TaxID=213953 RepID=A0AAV1L6B5_9NEOP